MRDPRDILYNFHWIVPGEAARSAQAYAAVSDRSCAHHGIASMINLRGPNPDYGWWRYEKRVRRRAASPISTRRWTRGTFRRARCSWT